VEIDSYLRPGVAPLEATWLAWAETEKRKRLGFSIYVSPAGSGGFEIC